MLRVVGSLGIRPGLLPYGFLSIKTGIRFYEVETVDTGDSSDSKKVNMRVSW